MMKIGFAHYSIEITSIESEGLLRHSGVYDYNAYVIGEMLSSSKYCNISIFNVENQIGSIYVAYENHLPDCPRLVLFENKIDFVICYDQTVQFFKISNSTICKQKKYIVDSPIYTALDIGSSRLLIIYETGVDIITVIDEDAEKFFTNIILDYKFSENKLIVNDDGGAEYIINIE